MTIKFTVGHGYYLPLHWSRTTKAHRMAPSTVGQRQPDAWFIGVFDEYWRTVRDESVKPSLVAY